MQGFWKVPYIRVQDLPSPTLTLTTVSLHSTPSHHTTTHKKNTQTQGQGEKEKEINDCKLIVQNIVYGTKTLLFSILYCTRHYHSAQQHEAARAAAMAAGQVRVAN